MLYYIALHNFKIQSCIFRSCIFRNIGPANSGPAFSGPPFSALPDCHSSALLAQASVSFVRGSAADL